MMIFIIKKTYIVSFEKKTCIFGLFALYLPNISLLIAPLLFI